MKNECPDKSIIDQRPLAVQKLSNNHREWVLRWSNPLLVKLDIVSNLQITST